MINNGGNSSLDGASTFKNYHVLNFNNAISKRKKIKDILYGSMAKGNLLQQKEKEELL